MKPLYLILIITSLLGCREKKTQSNWPVVMGLDSAHWIVEDRLPSYIIIDTSKTLIYKSSGNFKFYSFVIQDSLSNRARRDSFGNWEINGDCKRLLEVVWQATKRNSEYTDELRSRIKELEDHIQYIKVKQAEYRYAENKKEAGTFAFYGTSIAELPDSIIEMLTGSPIAKPDTIFKNQ